MFVLNSSDKKEKFDGILKENFITIAAATRNTGYNGQYLRRLLRNGRLTGVRVGQVWLIRCDSLNSYLESIRFSGDRRCGAKGIEIH